MSGTPQGQGANARPLPPGIRVNQIQTLPHLTDAQKATYTRGVASLYEAFQKHDKDSPEYKTAAAKLLEFTKKMGKEMNEWKANQAAAAAGQQSQPPQQPAPERPQSQGQQAQQSQQPGQQNQAPAHQPGGPRQPALPPQILQHVQTFPYALPPNIVAGTPEAENKLKEMKNTYASMLHKQEQLASNLRRLQSMVQERQAQGQEIPQNWGGQKQQMEQQYTAVKNSVAEFRKSQENFKQAAQNQQSQQQQSQGPQQTPQQPQQPKPTPQPQQQAPSQQAPQQAHQQPNGQQVKNDAGNPAAPPTPAQSQSQMQMGGQQAHPPQQQQQQQQGAQAGNNQQMANNAAVQAARQQQMNAGQPPMSPAASGPQQQGQPAFSGQMGQQQPINPQRPPLNPQQPSQMNQMQHSPHPQSAGGPNGPVPLTHGQAMSNAARAYSDSRGTPQIPAAQGYQPMGNREQISNPKMPIPKTLNAPPPHPVNMGPARPTLGGPSNGAPGMMGQPVIAGHPQYHLEGDENRVLSKKKLDELVRQVTGAGEPTGEALSPEVEEAMLQLADDFLDNVVSSACKLAKLRESSQLEIRDIQNILERNYNIRIPGYASDEVRTVRKFQPAPGWTQKMNAVQAAKVMGGKTD
ncbi:Transcription initiation factor TFIID [Macrophomina phaseolina MS6]|uniref:Transcription initiation factor TFIID n=1 Tax=Macrophomina phaseolina (strain MS6) TaxID=1126212 RepID=K2RZQ8_MACPH|nr:Transcription initiation factor TFIID [Macrophomina phaseolina MS6]